MHFAPGRNSEDKKIGTDNFVCYARLFFTPRLEYKIYCRVSLEEDPGVRVQSEMATVTVDSSECVVKLVHPRIIVASEFCLLYFWDSFLVVNINR